MAQSLLLPRSPAKISDRLSPIDRTLRPRLAVERAALLSPKREARPSKMWIGAAYGRLQPPSTTSLHAPSFPNWVPRGSMPRATCSERRPLVCKDESCAWPFGGRAGGTGTCQEDVSTTGS